MAFGNGVYYPEFGGYLRIGLCFWFSELGPAHGYDFMRGSRYQAFVLKESLSRSIVYYIKPAE